MNRVSNATQLNAVHLMTVVSAAWQGVLDLLKAKVMNKRTGFHSSAEDHIKATLAKAPDWLLEAERTREEKQELVNRLIVQSQHAFFMAKVNRELRLLAAPGAQLD